MEISRIFLTFEPLDDPEGAVLAKFLEAAPVLPDSEDKRIEDGEKANLLKDMPGPVRDLMKAADAMVQKKRAEERIILARSVVCSATEEVAVVFKRAKDAFSEIELLERTGMKIYDSSTWRKG
jgi:hypothetical protein